MDDNNTRWEYLTASGLVIHQKCFIHSIIVAGAAAGNATGVIYDGDNTTGRVLLPIAVLSSDTKQFLFLKPLPCEQGVYIDFTANITGVAVQFSLREP